jgi:cbb3-type cytochrome oxidase maturation protein
MPTRTTRTALWICRVLLAAVLVAGLGFSYKLLEFSREALESEVASFAVVPLVVYVLVALGFASLFVWAVLRGQFRDIEGPKYRLLEEEERHDRAGV